MLREVRRESKTIMETHSVVQLSTKGQLVIPQHIRKSLNLRPGMGFHVSVEDNKIILSPVRGDSAIDALYGRYADMDLLSLLEAEHQQEIENSVGGNE